MPDEKNTEINQSPTNLETKDYPEQPLQPGVTGLPDSEQDLKQSQENLKHSRYNFPFTQHDLKEIQHDLEESREFLASVINNSLDSIQVFEAVRNEQGKVIDFIWLVTNSNAIVQNGDVIGKRLLEQEPGIITSEIFGHMLRVTHTGIPWEQEQMYPHKRLRDQWYYQAIVKYKDGILMTTRNITAQKKADLQVLKNKELLQTIMDASNMNFALYKAVRNADGAIIDFTHEYINPKTMQVLGKDFTGKLLSDHGENGISQIFHFIEAIETGQTVKYVKRVEIAGNVHWISFTNSPLSADRLVHRWEDITEQKNTELEILRLKDELTQKATNKYLSLFNSIDEGFCIIEVLFDDKEQPYDYRFLEVNASFEKQTGLRGVVGKTIKELAPEHEQHWFDAYGRIVKSGKPERFENEAKALGHYYEVYAFCMGSAGENQVAVLFNDVTERRAEKEGQAFLLNLSDSIRAVTDPVKILTTVTRQSMEFFNADRCYYVEISGEDAIILQDVFRGDLPSVSGKYPIKDYTILKSVIDHGKPFSVEDVRNSEIVDEELKKLCLLLQVISSLNVPVIKQGKVTGLLCFVQSEPRTWRTREMSLAVEIAERTWAAVEAAKSEQALQVSEERNRIILQSAGMASWDWNLLKDRVTWNTQHYILLGLEPIDEEKNALNFLQTLHPEDIQKVQNLLLNAIENNTVYQAEFRIIRADDKSVRWMSSMGTVIEWIGQKASRMVGVMFDVTDSKTLQQKKDDFLGIASHELKTPVTSIKIYAEIIEEILGKNPALANTGLLSKLNQQIDRLTSLINNLLDTTRAKEGRIEYRKTHFDINQLLRERVEEMQLVAGSHHLLLHLDKTVHVYADRERIGQVLVNFLSNAIKYSSPGSDIDIYSEVGDNNVKISIADKGIGIAPELVNKVFERFYRVDNSTMSNYPGMGLGLYITSEIIKNHEGSIHVESKEGEGSVFHFTLPF